MKIRLLLLLVGAVACIRADEICIKQIEIAVPTIPIKLRECRYLVADDGIEKALIFSPPSEAGHLPVLKALDLAYDEYFAKHRISRNEYYNRAQITLEKVDDYTESPVAREIRRRGSRASALWFYIIKCGDPEFGKKDLGPAPVVILMDGTVIQAKERLRPLPGMS